MKTIDLNSSKTIYGGIYLNDGSEPPSSKVTGGLVDRIVAADLNGSFSTGGATSTAEGLTPQNKVLGIFSSLLGQKPIMTA